MALKTTAAAILQHGHQRRLNSQALIPLKKRSSKLAARYMAVKRVKHEERKIEKQKKRQENASSSAASSPTPEPATPAENQAVLQNIFGRYLDDKDRSAADILATLCMTGLLSKKATEASEVSLDAGNGSLADSPRSSLSIHDDDVKPSEVALPSMQQTNIMLQSWRSESGIAPPKNSNGSGIDEIGVETETASGPMTPALSFSSSSVRSSFSLGSPAKDDQPASPVTHYAHMPSPSGPPPPPYDAWRKSIVHADASPSHTRHSHQHKHQSPFSTYEQNYFSSTRNQGPAGPNGMPSPPQSPTDAGSPSEYCYKPTITLPTPPQSFSASMQQQRQQPYQPHATYQSRYRQYELPQPTAAAPMPPHRMENIATTVVTLPPPGLSREPLTPVSPLTLPSAFGRNRSSLNLSPRMAAKLDGRKDRLASSSSPSSLSSPPTKRAAPLPKPHCNVKYETAELDFIMYQRTTKNRAWDDVTASFNAALPRLRQYADLDYMHMGAAASVDSKAAMDRYRARPERTTPGLQASYYRQRLALPLLDEAGQLVFDGPTGKQVFTEVMVRDDKSRKKMRRLNSVAGAAAAASAGAASASKGGVSPDDTRVHLVLYFPERVAYYDYWFVSEDDKALARQRAYERNMQRAQRGLAAWHPGSDDPETGILIRNKD